DGTNSRLWASHDGGQTWRAKNPWPNDNGLFPAPGKPALWAVGSDCAVYAVQYTALRVANAADAGIYKSANDGASWIKILEAPSPPADALPDTAVGGFVSIVVGPTTFSAGIGFHFNVDESTGFDDGMEIRLQHRDLDG